MRRKRKPHLKKKNSDKEMVNTTNKELKNSFKDSKVVLKSHQNPRKYSQIFHEFMEQAINEVIHDEELLKKTLDLGQIVWNTAIAEAFPEHQNSKTINVLAPLLKLAGYDQEFISEFLKRKRKLFGGDNFFIVKQTMLLDPDGRLSISVSVLPVED